MVRRAVLLAVCALVASGCSPVQHVVKAKPDPQATVADVRELRAAPFPIYWLGSTYKGRRLTAANLYENAAVLRYGQPNCNSTRCEYPVSVFTERIWHDVLPRPDDPREPPQAPCFANVRGALLMGCRQTANFALYTGKTDVELAIFAIKLHARDVVRALRPLTVAGVRGPFPPPTRTITCARMKTLPEWFARRVPAVLRPRGCR